jgi:uncharacterized membrane protein
MRQSAGGLPFKRRLPNSVGEALFCFTGIGYNVARKGGKTCHHGAPPQRLGEMKENYELRAISRSQLDGGWLAAVGMLLIYTVIVGLSGLVVIGPFVLIGPLTLGFRGYYLKISRGETVNLENLFDGFRQFGSSFLLWLLESVFLALWTCLLIIPGIVKCFSYSMAFYILRDNPEIGALGAISLSRKMMVGYKGKLFGLYISFIGWGLLCCLSFGIGFLWLIPYIDLSCANFYEDLKQNQSSEISYPAS